MWIKTKRWIQEALRKYREMVAKTVCLYGDEKLWECEAPNRKNTTERICYNRLKILKQRIETEPIDWENRYYCKEVEANCKDLVHFIEQETLYLDRTVPEPIKNPNWKKFLNDSLTRVEKEIDVFIKNNVLDNLLNRAKTEEDDYTLNLTLPVITTQELQRLMVYRNALIRQQKLVNKLLDDNVALLKQIHCNNNEEAQQGAESIIDYYSDFKKKWQETYTSLADEVSALLYEINCIKIAIKKAIYNNDINSLEKFITKK